MRQVGSNDNHALLSTSLRFEPWRDAYDGAEEDDPYKESYEESEEETELDAVLRDWEDLLEHAQEHNKEIRSLEDLIL